MYVGYQMKNCRDNQSDAMKLNGIELPSTIAKHCDIFALTSPSLSLFLWRHFSRSVVFYGSPHARFRNTPYITVEVQLVIAYCIVYSRIAPAIAFNYNQRERGNAQRKRKKGGIAFLRDGP